MPLALHRVAARRAPQISCPHFKTQIIPVLASIAKWTMVRLGRLVALREPQIPCPAFSRSHIVAPLAKVKVAYRSTSRKSNRAVHGPFGPFGREAGTADIVPSLQVADSFSSRKHSQTDHGPFGPFGRVKGAADTVPSSQQVAYRSTSRKSNRADNGPFGPFGREAGTANTVPSRQGADRVTPLAKASASRAKNHVMWGCRSGPKPSQFLQ